MYGIYLFKVETFLLKRHQVTMFLSTFQVLPLFEKDNPKKVNYRFSQFFHQIGILLNF